MANLLEQTRKLYQRLNDVEAAKPYLLMKNRDVEVRTEDQTICIQVQNGQVEVAQGARQSEDYSVIQTNNETWGKLSRSRLGYTDAGGGMGGNLRCIEGKGNYTDMSWFGILTRLAQENR